MGLYADRLNRKRRAMDKNILQTLLNAAKGNIPADTVVKNGKIVNVFTNTGEENFSVVIKDGWIVSIEENKGISAYQNAKIIDAEGAYLCPGFIDSHTHIDGDHGYGAEIDGIEKAFFHSQKGGGVVEMFHFDIRREGLFRKPEEMFHVSFLSKTLPPW